MDDGCEVGLVGGWVRGREMGRLMVEGNRMQWDEWI